jgi:hypothetical protein
MITQSGCFGQGKPNYDQIDTAAEAAAAVEAIEATPSSDDALNPTACAVVQLGACFDAMARRVRLLTFAVALLALYVIVKELN